MANPDSPSGPEDSAGFTFNVLTNDTDIDGGPLTVTAHNPDGILNGTLTDDGGGDFTYTPNPDFFGNTESFTYTVDDGAGGTDTGNVTIDVTAVPDDPEANNDAYSTPEDIDLVLAAPGVLTNDNDVDGDPLTVNTTPVTAPTDGTLTLNADGSLTYTPDPGFSGTDSFVYEIDDGTARTDTATMTITVNAAASLLYLGTSGASSEEWDFTTTAPAAASPVPDFDGDGDPGLTIKASSGNESEPDLLKRQEWTHVTATPLNLTGTLKLGLWATAKDFEDETQAHPYLYFYDCAPGGTGCVSFHQADIHFDEWSEDGGWTYRELNLGSVSYTVPAGRELRMLMLHGHEDYWFAMTLAYPSRPILP